MDSAICAMVRIPTRAYLRFEAHEGEINSIKWSPHGLNVATGGSDRKIKLWDVSKGQNTLCSTLRGSNGSIMSIDYDSGQHYLLLVRWEVSKLAVQNKLRDATNSSASNESI